MFPIRLSDQEREQIAGAVERRKLSIGGFVRQAALAASAIVQEKATVTAPTARERLAMVDREPPKGRYIEAEW